MNKLENIIILAAGDGTRFWPLSDKNIFSFLETPLVLHLVKSVAKYTKTITVITNPYNDSIIKSAGQPKLQTLVVKDPTSSSMGKALLEHSDALQGSAFVINAVDIIDFNVFDEVLKKITADTDYLFIGKKTDTYFPGGYAKFENNRVAAFIEKPAPNETPSNIVKLVFDYFKDIKKFTEILKNTQTGQDDLYEQAINIYIKQYKAVEYVAYDSHWYTLKFPWHVLPMMKHFLMTLSDKVIVGKNVKIAETARVIGPCFIGDNTVIGDFAMVRESMIGKNCLIGGYSEVTRSYLGDDVFLHRNYVGDSVLDKKVLFGAQAATANFRFDAKTISSNINGNKIDSKLPKFGAIIGAGSKIGVNATLCPGVKIGKNTFVGPGDVVDQDIDDNKFIFKEIKTENKNR